MGCEDCGDTGVVDFEDHEMPCPYCRPDDAREASSLYDPPDPSCSCPACGSVQLTYLGRLGQRDAYRCRDCGLDLSYPKTP